MQYLGSSFSLVLGAWRLRFSFALEDAVAEAPAVRRQPEAAVHHHLYAVGEARGARRA